MSLLDINMNEIPELKLLDDGEEVDLIVVKVDEKPKKNEPGKMQLKITFADPSDELVDDMISYLPMLTAEDKLADPKAYSKAASRWRDFCTCFGIDTEGGIETTSIPGQTGPCIIGVENDPQYKRKNVIRSFVIGK